HACVLSESVLNRRSRIADAQSGAKRSGVGHAGRAKARGAMPVRPIRERYHSAARAPDGCRKDAHQAA
ncbi:hypothetical protein, partial [Paraburkholderia sp.]|uniref:hypothetical protein n=1 Tax=Paraburkholderia sp. TaxID=1926495 RepID=UPI00286EFACF